MHPIRAPTRRPLFAAIVPAAGYFAKEEVPS